MTWSIGPSGLLEREAARVIAFSPDYSKVLLIRGHDNAQPDRSWWFTPGGGIDPGETREAAAVREFYEETGLRIPSERLIGPVAYREAVFHFAAHDRKQFEHIYTLVLEPAEVAKTQEWNPGFLTDLERDVLDELRWWEIVDLADQVADGIEVFPRGLEHKLASWGPNWDGQTEQIFEL